MLVLTVALIIDVMKPASLGFTIPGMMGAAAGGMLPVTYALLAEMMPSKHRGWILVLVGGLGSIGGYFTASGLSAMLQPIYGWRILWLLNLPTGLILVLLLYATDLWTAVSRKPSSGLKVSTVSGSRRLVDESP